MIDIERFHEWFVKEIFMRGLIWLLVLVAAYLVYHMLAVIYLGGDCRDYCKPDLIPWHFWHKLRPLRDLLGLT